MPSASLACGQLFVPESSLPTPSAPAQRPSNLQPAVALFACEDAAGCDGAVEAVVAAVPEAPCVLQLQATAAAGEVEGLHVSRGGVASPWAAWPGVQTSSSAAPAALSTAALNLQLSLLFTRARRPRWLLS